MVIQSRARKPLKWRSILGIVIVVCAIVLNMPILFGVLYILWAIQEMVYGEAYILENVSKRENKVLFYIIVLLWLFCGVYVFTDSLIHNWIEPINTVNKYNEYHMSEEEYGRYTQIENGYLYTDDDGNITYYPFDKH